MIRYFKRHILLVAAALTLGTVTRLLTPLSAILEQKMIDLIISGDMAGFLGSLWGAGAVVIGVAVCYFFNGMAEKRFSAKFSENLRSDLYDGIMRQSTARFEKRDTAEYMSYVTGNADTLAQNLSTPVFCLISYGISALAVLGIMFYYSPLLAGASLVCGALSMVLPLRLNKRLEKLIMSRVEKSAAMSVQLKESLNGHEVISSSGVLAKLRRRFIESSADAAEAEYRMGVTVSELENVGQVMNRAARFITFLIAGTMAARRDISIGTLVMFISLFSYFSGSMTIYAQCLPLLLSNKKNIKMLLGMIDGECPEFTGTADVGLEDRIEVRDMDTESLKRLVTVIHQNTFIFNDTVRFNICLGENISPEALQRALQLSGLDRFLSSIAGGLDGECGENGSHLSGGQRQQISVLLDSCCRSLAKYSF